MYSNYNSFGLFFSVLCPQGQLHLFFFVPSDIYLVLRYFHLTFNRNLLGSFESQWTIYSATTFLEKCRKVVLEKRFYKLRFFFWSTTFLEPDFSNQISRTTFLEPLFYNFLEKWLQNKWSIEFALSKCQKNGKLQMENFCYFNLCHDRRNGFKKKLSTMLSNYLKLLYSFLT